MSLVIQIVDQILRAPIEALDWVTEFGGAALRVEKQVNIDGDTISYPVSVNDARQCPAGDEPILSPDHTKKAVLWVEEVTPVTTTTDPRIPKKMGMLSTQTIRILGWVNTPALGEYKYNIAWSPAQDIIRIVHGMKLNNAKLNNIGLSDDLNLNRVDFAYIGNPTKKHDEIFAAYSMSQRQKWFVLPYDYFAIDIEVQWLTLDECLPVFVQNEPLSCPPGYMPPQCGPIVSSCEGNLIKIGEDGGACLTQNDLPDLGLNGIFSVENEGATAQVEIIQGHNPGTHYNGSFGASFLFGGTYIQGSGRQQGGELRQADGLQGASIWVWQEFSANAENANFIIQSKDTPSIENYKFNVKGLGAKWNDYGLGALLDDTAPYALGVTASGQIVELTKGSGGGDGNGLWTASNESDNIAVNEIRHGEQVLQFIGTNPQAGKVTKFVKSGSGFSVFQIESYADATPGSSSELRMTRGRGTLESPTSIISGTSIGRVSAWANTPTTQASFATFEWFAGSNFIGDTNHHTRWVLRQCVNSTTREDVFEVDGSDILFNQYRLGAKTGTAAYGLAVTTDGEVIETPKESLHNGIFDTRNEGGQIDIHTALPKQEAGVHFPDLWLGLVGGGTQRSFGSNSLVFGIKLADATVFAGGYWSAIGSGNPATLSLLGSSNFNVRRDSDSTIIYQLAQTGQVNLTQYGSGAFDGTPVKTLGLDASNNVVTFDNSGGGSNGIFDAGNNGATVNINTMHIANTLELTSDTAWMMRMKRDGTTGYQVYVYSDSPTGAAQIRLTKFGGTMASPTQPLPDQNIGGLQFATVQSNLTSTIWGAQISGNTGVNWNGTTNKHTSLKFDTIANGSTNNSASTRIIIDGDDIFFNDYTGSNKDATPARTLGVDANGKVITYTPTAQIAGIENIHITDSDFTLPLITQIGENVIIVNPIGGGGTIHALASPGNSFITSNTAIVNGHCEVFVAVSMTQWAKIG